MSGLNYQPPYEVKDFSGGLTENAVPGSPSQYQVCDNLIITWDKKLRSRPGSVIFDTDHPKLPSAPERVGALIAFDTDTRLIAQASQYLYAYGASGWSPLTGPTGNAAFGVGDASSVVSYSEWQRHLFLTNDAGTLPVKVYPDADGNLQIRTAGLPELAESPNWNTAALLGQCIELANEMKTCLLAHMADTVLHATAHAAPHAALTAIADATDEASLYTLVAGLISAYVTHVNDARLTSTRAIHHYFDTGSALNLVLDYTQTPTTAAEAAQVLDDLHRKYTWHAWATKTHEEFNRSSVLSTHLPSISPIGPVSSRPIVTANLDKCFEYANDVKAKFNAHLAEATNFHAEADTENVVSCPDATDYTSLVVLIAHLRSQYQGHLNDAGFTAVEMDLTTTLGSATVTGVAVTSSGLAAILSVGGKVYFLGFAAPVTVVTSALGTFDASALATANLSSTGYFINSSYHGGEDSLTASVLASGASADGQDLSSWLTLLTEVAACYTSHSTDSVSHSFAFPHLLRAYDSTAVTAPLIVSAPAPEVAQYVYAFHYLYEYTVGDVTYQDLGPVVFSDTVQTGMAYPPGSLYGNSNVVETEADLTGISNLPVLTNSSGSNYDTASVKIRIYRTTDGGSTYYYLGEVTNGVTTFEDGVHDTVPVSPGADALQDGETLYTTGGVVDNDPPPQAKFIHVLNGIGYYGAITEDGVYFPNRIRQAISGDPDSCPGDFYDDLDDELAGLSGARGYLVALCKQSVYRIEGQFNELGQGFLAHQEISSSIGCLSSASIVKTEHGVFFAGTDGFYYTDAFQVQKLSQEFDRLYQAHTQSSAQRQRICGTYDRLNKQVWWTMQSSASGQDCDVVFICHLNFPNFPFTTASNGIHWRPSALGYFQGKILRGDSRGYVFEHDYAHKSDPRYEDSWRPVTQWGKSTIRFNYLSCAHDFGTSMSEKWVPRISVSGKNVGNLSLQINSVNDQETPKPLSTIRYRRNLVWGDPTVVWGDESVVWGADGTMDEWRRFPAGSMRTTYKQIELTNAFTLVAKSDVYGLAVRGTGASTFQVTLAPNPGYNWPMQPHDYYIYFSDDDYTEGFLITVRDTDSVITCEGTSPGAASDLGWIIKGYPKDEAMHLLGYSLQYAYLGKGKQDYRGAEAEGSSGNA